MISFVWAQDQSGLIGADGKLPWDLPADRAYFKRVTLGHPIVYGAKTYVSFNRPLPGRRNIVLSTHHEFPAGIEVCPTLADLERLMSRDSETNFMVIGGAQIFAQLLPQVDRLYRTLISGNFAGDTWMPVIDYHLFHQVHVTIGHVDAQNRYPHRFEIWER